MNACTTRFLRPAATVIEKADGFLVEADLPGVTRDGLQITLENDTLTITGQRQAAPSAGRILYRESSPSPAAYRRAFELGGGIDRSCVAARIEQGVLQIFLPKAEAARPRRIEIGG